MMLINSELVKLNTDSEMLGLFRRILESRIISKFELAKQETDQSKLTSSLEGLVNLGLINEKKSSFDDFNKYFPTKQGLELEKMIR